MFKSANDTQFLKSASLIVSVHTNQYSFKQQTNQETVHTVRVPLYPATCIFITPFLKSITFFLSRFFQEILSLCMVSIQEQFVIKSLLWWRAYGSYYLLTDPIN